MCTCTEERVRKITVWDRENNLVEVEEVETYSCNVDIDLHRYKCRKCGEIGYYSKAAKDFLRTNP